MSDRLLVCLLLILPLIPSRSAWGGPVQPPTGPFIEKIFERDTGAADFDLDLEEFITHDGLKRRTLVHIPSDNQGTKPLPVVLNFHDEGKGPESQRRESQMNRLADQYGFMVVYPEATGKALRFDMDDVGFVSDLLDHLQDHYQIDDKRIYATGLGNGAAMAYGLASELPNRIAAVAAVDGVMGEDTPGPKRAVPIVHFQGLKDEKISDQAVSNTIAQWMEVNNCLEKPVGVNTEQYFVMERYEPAPGERGAPVVLYKLTNIGHQWPLGPFNAGAIMWEFFAQHPFNTIHP